MNEKVKEKQYFVDVMNFSQNLFSKKILILILLSFVIGIIATMIYYNINVNKFEYEINSFSSDKVERLDEIYDIFITEDSRFSLKCIPEDVTSYNVEYDGNEIKFHYSLKSDENFSYAPPLYMDVTISKDLKVLEKSKSYESEEEYMNLTKTSIRAVLFLFGFFTVPVLVCVSYIPAILIGILISYIHKRIDLSKESKRETEGV